ncbi:hypothetical protein EPN28_04725 [Patescibacteria group bacterium]|nr:MAG: hypothetical protein EPN28_04725 [Patescibacteria group bacterium]
MENLSPTPAGQTELQQIKQEILSELGAKPKAGPLNWGSLLVTIILLALTALSIVQVAQSYTIMNKVRAGGGTVAPAAAGGSSANSAMPDMVGGC